MNDKDSVQCLCADSYYAQTALIPLTLLKRKTKIAADDILIFTFILEGNTHLNKNGAKIGEINKAISLPKISRKSDLK